MQHFVTRFEEIRWAEGRIRLETINTHVSKILDHFFTKNPFDFFYFYQGTFTVLSNIDRRGLDGK